MFNRVLPIVLIIFVPLVFGSDYSSDWSTVRNKYIERYGRCEACGGVEKLEVHHIIPVSHGGNNLDDNLITLCEIDHFIFGHLRNWRAWNPDVRKHSKTYFTWMNKRKE